MRLTDITGKQPSDHYGDNGTDTGADSGTDIEATDESADPQLAAIKNQEKQLKVKKAQITANKANQRLSKLRSKV
jgi:hypothetical protein